MTTKPIAVRMSIEDLAKARDGLINKGIPKEKLRTFSAIVKQTFYYGILVTCEDPKAPPSADSLLTIKQKIEEAKKTQY